ncbi:integrase, catalytic region, zinc finger, CCHC-type containing protein, partial [Tanacetum coccineum]
FTENKLSDQKAGSKGISGDRSKLINYVDMFIGTVRFENDQFAAIVGYGDYKLGNTIISKVYYVEGLSHNLFSVGQFCDGGLEVVFRQHTCHIRNKDMVDLLQGSRSTNMYSISLNEMLVAYPVCLLTKASSTKSWLWHRHLNYLNFGTLNELARNDLVRGLPMLKYDNGIEFVNKTLTEFFESVGITHNTSVPRSLCYPTNDYDDLGKLKAKANIGLEPNPMAPMHNGAGPEISALHSGRSCSKLVNDPTTPSVPPSVKQLEELFQPLFVDDEEFPPAIQTPPVRVNAALVPEIATGSPSTSINTEDAPAATTSSSESQTPPPDTGVTGIETLLPTND